MARTFDGSNDSIEVARYTEIEALNLVSWGVWVKRNGAQDNEDTILRKEYDNGSSAPWYSWGFEVSGTTLAVAGVGSTSGFASAGGDAMPDGIWQHLCGTYDETLGSNRIKLYQDGIETATANGFSADINYDTSADGNLDIGRRLGADDREWTGDMAEFFFYDVLLTTIEITSLASGLSPLLIRPQSLQLYLPMHGTASPEINLVNVNTGTVSGATKAADHPNIFYPKGQFIPALAAAGGGGPTIPVLMNTYRQMMT